jgi:TonB family protein
METKVWMNSRKTILAIAGFVVAATLHVDAGVVKVIANPSVKTDAISSSELRAIFLLQKRILKDRSAVEPVLQKSGDTHESFVEQYLNRDSEEIRIYYQGLVFTGKAAMPKQVTSDAEMVEYVARSKGAIGYVSGDTQTDGVKVLTIGLEKPRQERTLVTRVEPDYPETLRDLHISGTVRLELTVSPKGTVESVVIAGGNPILAENAVKAVKQWIYSPAASRSTVQVTIPFGPKP